MNIIECILYAIMQIQRYILRCIFNIIIIHSFISTCNSQSQTFPLSDSFYFLPQTGISLDYSIIDSDVGFTAKQSKEFDLQILCYNSFKVSMYVNENVYTSRRNNFNYYPFRISYYMDFAFISYQLDNSQIGITFNHICNNTIDKPQRSIGTELRWYGIGIKWYSSGMQVGKSYVNAYNSSLLSLDNLHYSFYIGYPFLSKVPEYKYMSNCTIRYDLPFSPYIIPFLQIYIGGLVYPDYSLSVNRMLQFGCMIPSSSVTFIPYGCYGTIHDSIYPGVTDTYYAFGLKAESLIGYYYNRDPENYRQISKGQNTSLHFLAGYSKTISSEYYNFTTDLAVTLQHYTLNSNYAYFSSYLNHSSESKPTALYPRFINISLKSGYAHQMFPDHHLHLFYQHYRRHDGNEYRGQTENYHSLGLSLKHGFLTDIEANQVNVSGNHMLYNNFHYEIEFSYIVAQQNYPYSFIITPMLYYIFGHWSTGTLYAGIEMVYFTGKQNNYEYSIESGIIFATTIPLTLYYSFKRDIDVDIVGGAVDFYHVIGMKLKI